MGFLNPWLLWVLPAAALPLLLHLWLSRRVRTVEIGTFRFLFDSYVQQRRRLKFLEALVAALRTLFLLVLVLVVARPVVEHWSSLFGGDLGREIILMVDCSGSMNAHTDGVSSLERAKTTARALAKRMGRGDRLTLIRVGGEAEELFSRFSSEAEKIDQEIASLEVSSSRANLLKALNLVSRRLRDQRREALVYFLTDCQATAWRDVRDQNLAKLMPEGSRLTVVNVGSNETVPNRAVLGEAPRNPRAILGLPVMLRPRVVNYGSTRVDDLPVSVFVEEKEVARLRLALLPSQSAEREVIYVPEQAGVLKGRFEIPLDRFPDDDSFLFTLTVVPQLNVLLVRPNPKDAKDPYQNEALYLYTALTAGTDETFGLAGADREEELIRSLNVKEIAEPGLNADQLQDVSVVILANCGGLKGGQYALLRDFVFEGGGLLILPGDRVKGANYNDHLFTVPNRPEAPMLAVNLGDAEGDPEEAVTFERFSAIDFNHPVMTVFGDPDVQFFRTVQFFRRFRLDLPEQGTGVWTLARFGSGFPALVEGRFGEGAVTLAAFPGHTRWTNLPMKPEFVPLVLRLVGRLARKTELEGPSVVAAGGTAEITADPSWAPAKAKITDAEGGETTLEFQWSGTRLLTAFEQTEHKGYYTVEVTGVENQETPRQGALSFAVNLARDESDFRTVGENQLRDWLGSDEVSVVDASAQTQHLEGSIGEEREIWRPLIYLMFVIIAIEFMLSTSSYRARSEDGPQSLGEHVRRLSPGAWIGRMTGAADFEEY